MQESSYILSVEVNEFSQVEHNCITGVQGKK